LIELFTKRKSCDFN